MSNKTLKFIWNNIDKIGIIISIVLSSAAFLISTRSCSDSNDALQISQQEYQSKRNLVLESIDAYNYESIKFKPFNNNHKLQMLNIYFPPSIQELKQNVTPPNFEFYFGVIQDSVQLLIDEVAKDYTPKTGSLNIPGIQLPVLINSNFVVGGENLWSRAIYNLEFNYNSSLSDKFESRIYFQNLMFVGKWTGIDRYQSSLGKQWHKNLLSIRKRLSEMNN